MLQSMKIVGGSPLIGEIPISGAKNLALPALVATLLTEHSIIYNNVPNLVDVTSMLDLLNSLGTEIVYQNHNEIILKTLDIQSTEASYDYVRKLRASILVLGALIARCGKANVPLPGGDAIGTRGVDLHIKALEAMGAEITIENGYIIATATNRLVGCDITLRLKRFANF